MRKHFPGYYRPTDDELKDMWDRGIISLDANVLLNLYRYTPPTRERFLELVDRLKDQVWLTHQAAFEFHRNRLEVITQQRDAYDDIVDSIVGKNLTGILTQVQQQYSRHSAIDAARLEEVIKDAQTRLTEILTNAKEQHPDFLAEDDILERLTALFDGKVGDPYAKEDLGKKYGSLSISVLQPRRRTRPARAGGNARSCDSRTPGA